MTRGALQKTLLFGFIALIAIGLLYFIYRTFHAYFSGPSITVSGPADYSAFSTSTTVISGIALHAQDITLDGRSITIDDKGDFSETILLSPGYNIETLAAHDQFGHTITKKLELVYTASRPTTPANPVVSTSTSSTTNQ